MLIGRRAASHRPGGRSGAAASPRRRSRHRPATASTPRSVSSSSRRASSTRWPVSQWCGVVPVSARNRRANVRGAMCARRGQVVDGELGRRGARSARSAAARRVGASGGAGIGASTYCAWPPSRCGGTTIRRASVLATAVPCSSRTRCRHRSMPAAVPALVSTGAVVDVEDVAGRPWPREARAELVGVAPVRRAARGRRAGRPRPGRTRRSRRSAPGAAGVRRRRSASSTARRGTRACPSGGRHGDQVGASTGRPARAGGAGRSRPGCGPGRRRASRARSRSREPVGASGRCRRPRTARRARRRRRRSRTSTATLRSMLAAYAEQWQKFEGAMASLPLSVVVTQGQTRLYQARCAPVVLNRRARGAPPWN